VAITFRPPVTRPLHLNSWVRPAGSLDFRVTSPFAPRGDGFHGALDIGNGRLGDPVVAAAAGTVIALGNLGWPWSQVTTAYASGNYGGRMVIVEHAPRVVTIYCHLGSFATVLGAWLRAGQQLGIIGESGSAIGQGHLHFGLQAGGPLPPGVASHATIFGYGRDVDPWPFIMEGAVLGAAEVGTVLDLTRHKPPLVADAGPGTVYPDPDRRGTALIPAWPGQAGVGLYAEPARPPQSPADLLPIVLNMASAGQPRDPRIVYVGADTLRNIRRPGVIAVATVRSYVEQLLGRLPPA
jgi:murein DD-endopeptidase MepM/ murein hydrolase activator NlpD